MEAHLINLALGAAGSLLASVLTYVFRDQLGRQLSRLFRNQKSRLVHRNWHAYFIRDNKVHVEQVSIGREPYSHIYTGKVIYEELGREYNFRGEMQEYLFAATYRSASDEVLDLGAWMLQLSNSGNFMVGYYAWMIGERDIGSGFYQWSHVPLDGMVGVGKSDIDGQGVIAKLELPRGALVGIVDGPAKTSPTRYSLTVDGRSIEPKDSLRMINHSCAPTCELRDSNLFAIVEIEQGQELTIDYRKTELTISNSFQCECRRCGRETIGVAAQP